MNARNDPLIVMAFMLITIAGVMKLGAIATAVSMLVLVGLILSLASTQPIRALGYFLAYAALEGMYKYSTGFAFWVYVTKPILAFSLAFSSARARAHTGEAPFTGLLLLLCGYAALNIFHPLGGGIVSGIATATVWYIAPISLYFAANRCLRNERDGALLLTVLMSVSTIVSVFALVQWRMGEEWTLSHVPGYRNIGNYAWLVTDSEGQTIADGFRPASTTSYGGSSSAWSHLGFIIPVGLLMSGRVSSSSRKWVVLHLLLNASALVIAGVRSIVIVAMLEAVIITLASAGAGAKRYGTLVTLVFLAMCAFFAVERLAGNVFRHRYAETLTNPLASYGKSRGYQFTELPGFLFNFPLGVGYQRGTSGGTGGDYEGKYAANRETQFHSAAADMGVPGLLFVIVLIVSFAAAIPNILSHARGTTQGVLAPISGALVSGFLIGSIGAPVLQGADVFWIMSGLFFAIPRIAMQDRLKARMQENGIQLQGATESSSGGSSGIGRINIRRFPSP